MKNWNKNNPIAEFVRNQRKENKLTQIQLADYSGLGLRFVRDIEQ
jgi:transcriptional regulator with XRE-family HTH domain